jgi:hypothetical protein
VHRRHLPDHTRELPHHLSQALGGVGHRPLGNHLAFGICGGGALSQSQHRLVGLVGIQVHLAELGGRAKAQGQHAGGQRIQRAGVPGLFGAQQPLGFLQRIIAGKTQGFIKQQHPMHRAPLHPCARRERLAPTLVHCV